MLPSALTLLVLLQAARGAPTGGQEPKTKPQAPQDPNTGQQPPPGSNTQPQRPQEPSTNKTAQAVVEAAIGHSQTAQGGAFVPLMNMTLGSPPQELTAIFDTGSGDLIVGREGSAFCATEGASCASPQQGGMGFFNPDKSVANTSSLALTLETGFVNGEKESGDFQRADATVGGTALDQFQFGLASNGTPAAPGAPLIPVLGVGPVDGETNSTGKDPYPNLPQRMSDAGVIKNNVYGVYLNDFRSEKGSVVFSGVDAAKFTGELKEAPLVPDDRGKNSSFVVEFSSLQMVDMKGGQDNQNGGQNQNQNQNNNKNNNNNNNKKNNNSKRAYKRIHRRRNYNKIYKRTYKGAYEGTSRGTYWKRTNNGAQGGNSTQGGNKPENSQGGNGNPQGGNNGSTGGNNGSQGSPNLLPPNGLALVDTGNPELSLPPEAMDAMAKALGSRLVEEDGFKFIEPFNCGALAGKALRFGFNRDSAVVDVPLDMTVIPAKITDLPPGICDLAMTSNTGLPFSSLGALLMQSVYTVFDAERNRLMFASAVVNSSRSDVRELGPDWKGTVKGTGGAAACRGPAARRGAAASAAVRREAAWRQGRIVIVTEWTDGTAHGVGPGGYS